MIKGKILRDIPLDIPFQSPPEFSALGLVQAIGSGPSQDIGK
jgi:hypothetical protein